MIYDYGLNLIFIHIPRSAGCSISFALLPYMTLGGCWDLADRRHLPANVIKKIVGPDFYRMHKFYVYRPLSEILVSFTQFIARQRFLLLHDPEAQTLFSSEWKSILEMELDDEELRSYIWKRNGWPEEEEEWLNFWIGDIDDDNWTRLDFHNLEYDWRQFCLSRLGQEIPLNFR